MKRHLPSLYRYLNMFFGKFYNGTLVTQAGATLKDPIRGPKKLEIGFAGEAKTHPNLIPQNPCKGWVRAMLTLGQAWAKTKFKNGA